MERCSHCGKEHIPPGFRDAKVLVRSGVLTPERRCRLARIIQVAVEDTGERETETAVFDAAAVFGPELALITDPAYREFAAACLREAPPEFWVFPASTSGKHHPEFARGEGGLVQHTKAAVQVALDLLRAFPELEFERDVIIVALLLHDTCKIDPETRRTDPDHPLLPGKRYERFAGMLPPGGYEEVMLLIESHMGIWGPVNVWKMSPPLPERVSAALLVHLADYIASREWVSENGDQ
jgi:hypothetical protein